MEKEKRKKRMNVLQIEELGNNRYKINGEDVYAPNMHTAKVRYTDKNHKYQNNFQIQLKEENKKKVEEIRAKGFEDSRVRPAYERPNMGKRMCH